MRIPAYLSLCLVVAAAPSRAGAGQQPSPQPLRLESAIELALKNYPAMRAAAGQENAARAGVNLARDAYLPRTDLLWQQNRATRNNVAGLLLPQTIVPPISGPVAGTTSYDGLWGSAAGMLLSWEPIDFGLRRANIAVAQSLVKQATAGVELTRLQVAVTAADAFLAAVAADETVRAARANVERLQVLDTAVTTLVQNQLRPGADQSRADAELAAGRVQLFQLQRVAAIAHAALAEAVGLAGENVTPDAGSLLQTMPPALAVPLKVETHPFAQVQQAAVDTVRSREEALDRTYFPRVNFQSTLFARGAVAPGIAGSGVDGLFPDVSNWAAGFTFTFPVFDFFSIRARRQIEAGNEVTERARYDQTVQTLKAQNARARAQLDAARLVADNTPIELKAAQEAEARARARYDAGLATLTEVAEAQRLLAQAEIDDGVARLSVWQALLAEATARGDLAPFLDQVKSGAKP